MLCFSLTQWGCLSSPLEVPCGVHRVSAEPGGSSHAWLPVLWCSPCFLVSGFCSFLNDVFKERGLVLWCLRSSSGFDLAAQCWTTESTGSQSVNRSCQHMKRSIRTFYVLSCHVTVFYFLGWKTWQILRLSAQTSSVTERCLFMVIYEGPTWKITARSTCQVSSALKHLMFVTLLSHWARQSRILEFLKITQLCIICQVLIECSYLASKAHCLVPFLCPASCLQTRECFSSSRYRFVFWMFDLLPSCFLGSVFQAWGILSPVMSVFSQTPALFRNSRRSAVWMRRRNWFMRLSLGLGVCCTTKMLSMST